MVYEEAHKVATTDGGILQHVCTDYLSMLRTKDSTGNVIKQLDKRRGKESSFLPYL